ncbi:hypothetical protein V5O48_005505 [Marasmius crinis-equi]|uniref:HMG box domain-containing protein n=1 Tax=Marasmius crinis-equi TaxID=585013 RepID=A0ABR3FMK3_9AGAR
MKDYNVDVTEALNTQLPHCDSTSDSPDNKDFFILFLPPFHLLQPPRSLKARFTVIGRSSHFVFTVTMSKPTEIIDAKPPFSQTWTDAIPQSSPSLSLSTNLDAQASPSSHSSPTPGESPEPSPSLGTGVLPSSIPFPDPATLNTYRDDHSTGGAHTSSAKPKRKSHARRQPPGHIPRPRNAFILFRCDFVKQKKIPDHVETNHRNISRIVGMVWREMSREQKKPWLGMAEVEKRLHEERFPGYKYRPGMVTSGYAAQGAEEVGRPRGREKERGKGRRGRPPTGATTSRNVHVDTDALEAGHDLHLSSTPTAFNSVVVPTVPPITHHEGQRRSSSCPPPGAVPVQNIQDAMSYHRMNGYGQHTYNRTSRDDLSQRRPSRVTFYQSVSSNFTLPPHLAPSAVPPMYWNPPVNSPHAPTPVFAEPQVIMPTCPPGWDSSPPRAERWTEWTGDVETDLNRHVVLRSHDYDNSFKNGVPQWTHGLFLDGQSQSQIPTPNIPVFTNPFESVPTSSVSAPSEGQISPLDLDQGERTSEHTAYTMTAELESYRLPVPDCSDRLDICYPLPGLLPLQDMADELDSFDVFYQAAVADMDSPGDQLGELMPRLSLVDTVDEGKIEYVETDLTLWNGEGGA